MALVTRLLAGKPSMQVSDALTGSINLPSAGREVGDMELISRITFNANTSEVTFGGIPQNFKHLLIEGSMLMSASNGDLHMQFNGSSSTYSWHQLYGNGTSTGAGNGTSMSYTYAASNAGHTSQPYIFSVNLVDYTSSKSKVSRVFGGGDQNGAGTIKQESGLWTGTSAISSIRLYAGSGTINAYTTFSLYGIRG